uniref:Integrase zinc-binding domain-containing protein n=1 Tax=Arundo donax TaxID=35708 RepID=A0A0A9A7Q1_ARUDO
MFAWPCLKAMVKEFVAQCTICQQVKLKGWLIQVCFNLYQSHNRPGKWLLWTL